MSFVGHSLHASSQTRLVRTKLQIEGRARDLALFNLAIVGKLRGSYVILIRVEVSPQRGTRQIGATVRQKKNWAACQI
jgi:hypothetical protein